MRTFICYNENMKLRLFFATCIISYLALNTLPTITAAQFLDTFNEQRVVLNANPQFPSPFERVTIDLDDYSLGVAGSRITWEIDGVEQVELRNSRTIAAIAPDVGQEKRVRVRVTTPSNEVYTATYLIRPLYLDIIIEPYTFAPSWYQGRPLPSHGSQVLLTALLHDENGLLNPGNYTYVWTLENRVLNRGGIRGGFQQTITVPYGMNILLGLTVADARGQTIARRLITFPSVSVDLQFYEVNELFGLSHLAIGNSISMFGNSMTIRAVPYNLDTQVQNSQLFTEWRVDNRRQAVGAQNPFEITIVRSGFGQSRVNFKFRHLESLLQGGDRTIIVNY